MENQTIETNVVKPSLSFIENENEYRMISFETETELDTKIKEVEDFLNNNHGRGKSEAEKDQLYADAKVIWEQYATLLRDMNFSFYLNRKQYQFLTELLRDKMEYDVNSVFLAIELTDMLGEWIKQGTSKDDQILQEYTTDATEITYIYHLIAKHKVKGLGNSTYRFAEVLKRIGAISKIIAYYDTHAKNFSKDIQDWVASFEPNILIDGKSWGRDQATTEVEKPTKKSTKETTA